MEGSIKWGALGVASGSPEVDRVPAALESLLAGAGGVHDHPVVYEEGHGMLRPLHRI